MSETEIVNRALRRAGESRISDITDTVPNAGIARDVYAAERDSLLRSHTWNFATAREQLDRLAQAPAFGFQYAYGLPSDCLRVVSVHQDNSGHAQAHYKLESVNADGNWTRAVLSDHEALFLRYVRRVEDTTLMPPDFVDCLVLKLASIFATASVQSNTLYDLFERQLREAKATARSIDGISDTMDERPMGSWALSRHGGLT